MVSQIKEFTDLEQSMGQFSTDIQEALRLQRENVRNVNTRFISEVNELRNLVTTLNKQYVKEQEDIEGLKLQITSAKANNEISKGKYEDYQIRKNKLMQMRDQLTNESNELDAMVAQREQLVQDFRERLLNQASRDNSEVKLYEQLLGMTVDASKSGTLVFAFSNFNEKNPAQKSSLTLNVAGPTFTIMDTNPTLDQNMKQQLVDVLNTNNNLSAFIVRVREALAARIE
ncbi:similar to Saccharomyces cerevisiae YER018C SPC25 Component of the evolutionarily conserved kinetochore-associated Ndc80 complex (Ndc80p-Nuf2p-Spc24p-Spc25p) [Maudiozyma barnettii]|uniref:Kinetochore protein SPC25 n=1 Tax=Maudiozyma barnettii TaxID=61262 RepID=A0A8H2VDH6_9SACH|nr:kinetochore-associated Ndc80 complex subunit SPC25 [Kazachstania barnettii]CAB4253307.1 similar to Saccharomyces cerevisiae YER018C SPC25 Component of the evolutionarily conserved kinetochore-associated Ndc80 complex (Ndc80p-Nuf2p-Spc24p-Spc25p) [Kazachstania barnettii]CAD1780806.1 similar to Saccharomyces cerevisiae YER018C SPC25 Component of the evolutionarily conserved kinetochore-associated Ndc80 complex (Ndc80p-Nuf2p-Spc24p-Spc25p) [Kazachstania barnettii]